jgi:hypothetical protein
MTTDEALEFLRAHQPLPSDAPDGVLARFDEVRRHFLERPDDRCVPLLLGAMAEGDGHGVYQLVEGTLRAHPEVVVVDALRQTLDHPLAPVRCWSAEIAMSYPRPELIPGLTRMLRHGNPDEQAWAADALSGIKAPESRRALEGALGWITEEEVRLTIRAALDIPDDDTPPPR